MTQRSGGLRLECGGFVLVVCAATTSGAAVGFLRCAAVGALGATLVRRRGRAIAG